MTYPEDQTQDLAESCIISYEQRKQSGRRPGHRRVRNKTQLWAPAVPRQSLPFSPLEMLTEAKTVTGKPVFLPPSREVWGNGSLKSHLKRKTLGRSLEIIQDRTSSGERVLTEGWRETPAGPGAESL